MLDAEVSMAVIARLRAAVPAVRRAHACYWDHAPRKRPRGRAAGRVVALWPNDLQMGGPLGLRWPGCSKRGWLCSRPSMGRPGWSQATEAGPLLPARLHVLAHRR